MTEILFGLRYCAVGATVFAAICALCFIPFRNAVRVAREEEMEANLAGEIEGDLTSFAAGLNSCEAA